MADLSLDDQTDILRDMLELLKSLIPEENIDGIELLESIDRRLYPPDSVEERLARIEFSIPSQSLEDWFDELIEERITPRKNIHYMDDNGILSKNVNKDSFTKDDQEAGQVAKDALATTSPESSRERLEAEFERAARNARIDNEEARKEPKIWELLKRRLPNDMKQEDAEIRYIDQQQKTPDWYKTVKNIRRLGESLGYDTHHYKNVLQRFVSYFNPSLSVVTEKQHPNETAKFLARLTIPESDYDRLTKLLDKLERKRGESLQAVMSHLLAIVNSMYHDTEEPEMTHNINRLMIKGLLAFTVGKTNQDLTTAIEHCKRQKKVVNWERLLEKATLAERIYGAPTQELTFLEDDDTPALLYNVNPLVTTRIASKPRQGTQRQDVLLNVWPELRTKRQNPQRQANRTHTRPVSKGVTKLEPQRHAEAEPVHVAGDRCSSPGGRQKSSSETEDEQNRIERHKEPDISERNSSYSRDRFHKNQNTERHRDRDRNETGDRFQKKDRDNRIRSFSRDRFRNRDRNDKSSSFRRRDRDDRSFSRDRDGRNKSSSRDRN
jgi:hypothetical protein